MKIVSVAQMRALEAAAFAVGIGEAALQQQAGHAVAEEVSRLVQPGDRVVVLVGQGNNGRDGAVAADWLIRHGTPVDLVRVGQDERAVDAVLRGARLAVDALAGIGVTGALREPVASLVRALNQAHGDGLRVLALDIPSGIDADGGEVRGEAVWADDTVTLGGVKQGLLCFPAAERVGRVIPRLIGIPESAEARLPYGCLDILELARLVPSRPLDAHKYRFGRVLVVAGADHFLGAAVLCSGSAARVGAGLVTLAATRDVRLSTATHLPEVTYTSTDVRPGDGAVAARMLEAYLQSHSAVVLGPGLGRDGASTAFVAELLRLRPHEHSLVVDADGLFALAELPDWWTLLGPNVVLTPHAGELERLVGHPLGPEEPLWVHAGRLARQWGCVLLAKGPFTCIAQPDGRVDVWPHANAALATGGTGDVLAGVTGGLLAQGLSAWDAARLAVGIHGLAAQRVLQARRWRTLLASDLLAELPAVLAELAEAQARAPR
ncbi:MAG: NAD(P)H-hydrate dehydratase [Chloroflexi bacterium]|nr:NAD(P)H-hydrate dehydratase [Chloroflexota bacterium]